jgi:hypothetical protein
VIADFAKIAKVCPSGHILLPISFPALFTIRFGIPVLPLCPFNDFHPRFSDLQVAPNARQKKHGHREQAA